MSDWQYQVRIRTSERLSQTLRSEDTSSLADRLRAISQSHGMTIVNTFDAFKEYCDEAEDNGIEKYSLYHWTKATIEDPERKAKHLKGFAFYKGEADQIYEKELALSLVSSLEEVGISEDLLEIKLIDSNPANNPQPPSK
tara:strand:- start:565 stop:984 length:420 start_codon:yes stop_codon:yes gene_type:complete